MALSKTAEIDIETPTRLRTDFLQPESEFHIPTPSASEIVAAYKALASVVSARISLLLAGAAAFSLAWRVLESANPAPNALWALAIFSLVVFGPTVFLNARRAT